MILFLDYDGVLHPDPCLDASRLFEHAPRLEAVLADFPEVGVVLSTAWRTKFSEHDLLAPLPESMRQRILGQTPRAGDCGGRAARSPWRRQAECEQWLEMQGMAQEAWWALDDRPDGFAPYCERLLVCHPLTGFDERMARRLASALQMSRQRAANSLDLQLA